MAIKRSFETDWNVEGTKPDANMEANVAFKACPHPDKINAGIGMIMDGKVAFTPSIVRKIGREIAFNDTGYLSSAGNQEYLELNARHLVFGEIVWEELGGMDNVVATQTMGGTGALFVASDFLNEVLPEKNKNLLLDPGWGNHRNIFAKLDANPTTYVHENPETRDYDHGAYLDVLNEHPEGCPVLLQVAGYNNDGSERSEDQWNDIAEIIKAKKNIAILDFAYNGLVDGFGYDNYAIAEFADNGIPSIVCVSNSKNAGMYNMRLGALYMMNLPKEQRDNIQGFITNKRIRGVWSNPNGLPAATMAEILKSEEHRAMFMQEVHKDILEDILEYNKAELVAVLGDDFDWIQKKGGIFFNLIYDGFTPEQVRFLREEKHIFCPPSSRINVGGLPPQRIEEIAMALRDTISMV